MNKHEIIVETSARHVHLKKEDVETLFGAGKKLTYKRDLSQPGQFLSEERVDIEGPKGKMTNVAVLGPERPDSQVELSLTDARSLGLSAPVRESGDIKGSGAIKLTGPCGSVELQEGTITAKRHIHITPAYAEKTGLKDKQIIGVKITSDGRSLVFGDVVVRINPNFLERMHIDTDETNAAGISGEVQGELIF